MADVQTSNTAAALKSGASTAALQSVSAGARQAKEGARAAEAAADATADASRAAAKANSEIFRTQIETAQEVACSSLEASVRSLEGLTQTWTRACGVTAPDPDLAEQSAQNLQAMSQASGALAKGAQDVSRIWFDLTHKAVRSNLEAFSQLSGCRSMPELAHVQSKLMRESLQQTIESGEVIVRVSTDAIREATQAMRSQAQPVT